MGEINQHLGGFAEAEVAAPAPHVSSQLFYRRLDTNALGPSSDFPDSSLEPLSGGAQAGVDLREGDPDAQNPQEIARHSQPEEVLDFLTHVTIQTPHDSDDLLRRKPAH